MPPSFPPKSLRGGQPTWYQIRALAHELPSYPVVVREKRYQDRMRWCRLYCKLIVDGSHHALMDESGSEFVSVRGHCYLGRSCHDVESSRSSFMMVLTTNAPIRPIETGLQGPHGGASYDNDPLAQGLGQFISCPSLSSTGQAPHLSPIDRFCGPWASGGFGVLGQVYRTVGSWQSL